MRKIQQNEKSMILSISHKWPLQALSKRLWRTGWDHSAKESPHRLPINYKGQSVHLQHGDLTATI